MSVSCVRVTAWLGLAWLGGEIYKRTRFFGEVVRPRGVDSARAVVLHRGRPMIFRSAAGMVTVVSSGRTVLCYVRCCVVGRSPSGLRRNGSRRDGRQLTFRSTRRLS